VGTVHYPCATHNKRTPIRARDDRRIWQGRVVRRLDRLTLGLVALAVVLFAVGGFFAYCLTQIRVRTRLS
jgi:hypothetical protein